MPGKWVGGKGSKACPSKGDFIEGRVVDDEGTAQGTLFLEVKRLYSPGAGGRFIFVDVLSASDRFYRHWLTTEEGRVTTVDGSYHLCNQEPHECDVKGTSGTVVHIGKWRNWRTEELSIGLSMEYDKECRNQVVRYMKEGPSTRGGGGGAKKSPLIPYEKARGSEKPKEPEEKKKKARPSSSSQKKPDEESYSTSFGSEEEPTPKVTEMKKELEKLKAALKEEVKGHKKKKPKKDAKRPGALKKGDSRKKAEDKKKKSKPAVTFATGIGGNPDDDPPDYSAGEGEGEHEEKGPSDDSEKKKKKKRGSSKKATRSKKDEKDSDREGKKEKKKKKKRKRESSSEDSDESRKAKKKKKKKRDKGPLGMGTTDDRSDSSAPEDSDDTSWGFSEGPFGNVSPAQVGEICPSQVVEKDESCNPVFRRPPK